MSFMYNIISYFNLFKRPTLDEIVANELLSQCKTEQQSEAVIKVHRFQQYMAQANINALTQWQQSQDKENNHGK